MTDVVSWIWLLPVVAQCVLVGRVIWAGQVKAHKLLVLWVVSVTAITVGGYFAHRSLSEGAYTRVWVAMYVVVWSLTALTIVETCSRSLERYPRFSEVGNLIIRLVLISSGLLIFGSMFVAPLSWTVELRSFLELQGYMVQASFALLGLSILVFAWVVNLKLLPNFHSTLKVVTVFCAGEAFLASGISADWPSWSFYVGVAWATSCWAALAIVWRAGLEEIEVPRRASIDEARFASVLSELESINRGLADVIRRS